MDILEKFESPILSKLRRERTESDSPPVTRSGKPRCDSGASSEADPPDPTLTRVRRTDSGASSDGDLSDPGVRRLRRTRRSAGSSDSEMSDDDRIVDLQNRLADLKGQRS